MPDTTVEIAFGRGNLPVRLPADARPTVIRKRKLPKITDPHTAVRAALDAGGLARAAQGRRSACILICDITRPVPNHLFLRPMIEDLVAAGIPAARITVLVATGLHRPNEGRGACGAGRRPMGVASTSRSRTTSRATTPTTSTSA